MEKIQLHDKVFVPFISSERIEAVIDEVAVKINNDFAGSKEPVVFLCVLNGAIMFMAGIMKRVNIPAQLVSIKASSYIGVASTGDVKLGGLTSSVKGKNVIVFEDIVDTGNTVMALKKYLLDEGAADVRICTMLLKPEVYKQPQKIDYVGAEIPNAFIVGYGLDYNELGRNLNEIYILER